MHLNLSWQSRHTKWWTKWMMRRRASDTHVLTARNIYALPTRAGWMMLVTVAVLMLATINYQLSLVYVLIFLLMGAGVVGLFMTYRELTRMRLALSTNQELRGKWGDEIEVRIHTSSDGSGDQLLKLKLERTGSQPLPMLICETRYPLGLLRLWSVWRFASHVQVDPPDTLAGTAASHSQWALSVTSAAGVDAPRDGIKTDIRAYRVGDAPRDVLWKTVAKRPDTPASWGVRAVSDDEPPKAAMRRITPPNRTLDLSASEETKRRLTAHARQRDLTLLLVLLLIAMPFFQHLVWWYPLMACSLIGLRFWQAKNQLSPCPKWLQPFLIAALGVLVWIPFRSFSGIEASVSACLGLLGIKALELPKTTQSSKAVISSFSRDHWVLVFIGLFTLSAHFLVSQSLTSSVQVVLGLTALIYVLVMAHGKDQRPVKITLLLVIFGTPFMAVMFFLFPRFAPLWSLQEQKTIAQTGLTSEMRVGDMGEISRDNKIILRLKMDTPPLLDSKDIYLRSYVLPRFDGRAWQSYRFDNIGAQGVADTRKVKTVLDAPQLVGRGYTVMPQDAKPYQEIVSADVRTDAQSATRTYLQTAAGLPAGSNPRTNQWARDLREEAQFKSFSPNDWSNYLLGVLKSGGYRYTLAPGTYGLHIVDELLFDRKLGFCEHYATAYVVAMRNLGIPARVVTGYQGAEINPIDGLQVVRNSNAHAWAEYWDTVGGGAWQRVDPTAVIAPARIQNAENFNQAPAQLNQQGRGMWSNALLAPVFRSLWRARQSWEATNHAWEAWFTGYNQAAQMSWLKRLGIDNPSWKDLVQLLDAALLLLLLMGVAIYAWRGAGKQDPWVTLLQAIRDKVSQQGVVISENATPREIAIASPRVTSQMTQWLMDLEAARYAPPNCQNHSLATLGRQLKAL